MLNSYQSVLKYPEINPGGRGSLFGLQFAWQPLVLEHEHFAADITAKDRTLHQELQIEKVAGKWLWATQIKDRDTGKQILNCKDNGFPYGPTASTRCFPEMLSTDN